jgi:hypothetical protein
VLGLAPPARCRRPAAATLSVSSDGSFEANPYHCRRKPLPGVEVKIEKSLMEKFPARHFPPVPASAASQLWMTGG